MKMVRLRLKLLRLSTFIIAFILVQQAFGQQLTKTAEYTLTDKPVAASIDRTGNIYFGYGNGDVTKYSQKGELLYTFSPPKRFNITLLESWLGLKTFVYSAPYQEYYFLDRFMNSSERYSVSATSGLDFSGLATIENDRTLWSFNTTTQTLSKQDLIINEVIFENRLNLILNVDELNPTFIRAYQNLIFIADPNYGIAVFDNLGSYLETIPAKGVAFFSFYKDQLIYHTDGKLTLKHIYNQQKKEVKTDLSFGFVLMENNQLFGVTANKLQVFSITY